MHFSEKKERMILWVSEQKQYFKFAFKAWGGGDEAKKKEIQVNLIIPYVLSLVHKYDRLSCLRNQKDYEI